MFEIPPEAQAAIEEFNRLQVAQEAARTPREKRKEQRAGEAGSRPMTADEVIRLAESLGWSPETGGRHPRLVKGNRKVSIPVHGGSGRNLATGTLRAILKIIRE